MKKTNATCRLCGTRRARRACPALGHSICPVCCGTKRQSEIVCPSDCSYLTSSQSHPPAAVQRRREQDLRFLLPLLHGLTERQQHVTLLVQQFLRAEDAASLALSDADVVQATQALAETYETASRGIIYEHSAGLATAGKLSAELRKVIEAGRGEGLPLGDTDVAIALRRIEAGAREARSALGEDETSYLRLLRRVFQAPSTESPESTTADASSSSGLIVP